MQLKNITRQEILMEEVMLADNFFTRLKGLLGKKQLHLFQCMLISPCKSVHTFFMNFPIHVVFIDKNYKVVRIVKNMKQGNISPYVKCALAVIEMSADIEIDSMLSVGDELQLCN